MSPETNSTDRSYVGVNTSRVIPPAAGSSLYVASSAIASWSAKVVMAPAGDRSSASRDSAVRPTTRTTPGCRPGSWVCSRGGGDAVTQVVGRCERFLRRFRRAGALALSCKLVEQGAPAIGDRRQRVPVPDVAPDTLGRLWALEATVPQRTRGADERGPRAVGRRAEALRRDAPVRIELQRQDGDPARPGLQEHVGHALEPRGADDGRTPVDELHRGVVRARVQQVEVGQGGGLVTDAALELGVLVARQQDHPERDVGERLGELQVRQRLLVVGGTPHPEERLRLAILERRRLREARDLLQSGYNGERLAGERRLGLRLDDDRVRSLHAEPVGAQLRSVERLEREVE